MAMAAAARPVVETQTDTVAAFDSQHIAPQASSTSEVMIQATPETLL